MKSADNWLKKLWLNFSYSEAAESRDQRREQSQQQRRQKRERELDIRFLRHIGPRWGLENWTSVARARASESCCKDTDCWSCWWASSSDRPFRWRCWRLQSVVPWVQGAVPAAAAAAACWLHSACPATSDSDALTSCSPRVAANTHVLYASHQWQDRQALLKASTAAGSAKHFRGQW